MVEISLSGSGEGLGASQPRGYSTAAPRLGSKDFAEIRSHRPSPREARTGGGGDEASRRSCPGMVRSDCS